MVSDNEIARIFQIPIRMVQKWKNSNDYRYLIYNYLKLTNKDEIEAFFNYLLTPRNIDSANLAPLYFIYKKDFIKKISADIRSILRIATKKVLYETNLDWIHRYISTRDEYIDKNKIDEPVSFKPLSEILNNIKAVSIYSLFLIDDNNDLLYIELCNKIQEKDSLKKKINEIKKALKEGYSLKHMLYITNEKELPFYLRSMHSIFEDVEFWNAYMGTVAKKVFNAKKIIFVPNDLKIPKLTSKKSDSILEKIENELINKIIEIYESYPYSYEFDRENGIYKSARNFCEMIFYFSKDIDKSDSGIDINSIYTQLFLEDIRVQIRKLLDKVLQKQFNSYEKEVCEKKLNDATAQLHKIFAKHFLDMNVLVAEYWFDNLDVIKRRFEEYLEGRSY
jgi:hypothetical protein